jgi:hypothetical protein
MDQREERKIPNDFYSWLSIPNDFSLHFKATMTMTTNENLGRKQMQMPV